MPTSRDDIRTRTGTGTGARTATTEQPIPRHVWRLAGVIVFGAFMSGLDATVVNVGLDTMARDLHASIDDVQWVASAHLIALGVSLPACGWLGRRVGVGRLWLVALAAFTVASGLCAAHPRRADDPRPGRRPGRLGRVMATVGIAGHARPGVRTERRRARDRRRVLALAVSYQPSDRRARARARPASHPAWGAGCGRASGRHRPRACDRRGPGARLRAHRAGRAGHAARRGRPGSDPRRDRDAARVRAARPPPHGSDPRPAAVRQPTFAAACAATTATGAAMFGAWLLFPLYFQTGRGEGVLDTGLLLIALSAGTAVVMPWSGRLVDRLGGGVVSVLGCAAALLTTVPFVALDVHADGLLVQALLLLRGMAIALAAMPATVAAYAAVTQRQLPDATSLVNILQRVGGALGGSLLAVVLAARLGDGTNGALHVAFACLTAFSLLGLVCALWLLRTERESEAPVASVPVLVATAERTTP